MRKEKINKTYEKKYKNNFLMVIIGIIGIIVIMLCAFLFLGDFGMIMLPYVAIGGGVSIIIIWGDIKLKKRN